MGLQTTTAIIIALFLSGCVTTTTFNQSGLDCQHTVSSQLMGTGQVISCKKENQLVLLNSFPGVAIIEPIEKATEAAGIVGGAAILTRPRNNDRIQVHVGP